MIPDPHIVIGPYGNDTWLPHTIPPPDPNEPIIINRACHPECDGNAGLRAENARLSRENAALRAKMDELKLWVKRKHGINENDFEFIALFYIREQDS